MGKNTNILVIIYPVLNVIKIRNGRKNGRKKLSA